MSNVRNMIDQDDVLGGDSDADDFGVSSQMDHAETGANTAQKKKPGRVPLVVGLLTACVIVGFFGWKIVSPHLGGDRGALNPINPTESIAPAVAARVAQFEPESEIPPRASPIIAQQSADALTAAQLAGPTAPPQPGMQGLQPKPLQTVTDQGQGTTTVRDKQEAVPVPGAVVPSPIQPTSDDVARVNKRLDALEAAVNSLKLAFEKTQAAQRQRVARVAATAAPRPAAQTLAHTSPVTQKASAIPETGKLQATPEPEKIGGELQLQAVLQDRAWFKTRLGETITVAPGEEVKGVGVVQQIDVEAGRVVFTNGAVFR